MELSALGKERKQIEALSAELGELRTSLIAIGSKPTLEMAEEISQTQSLLDVAEVKSLLDRAKVVLESETRIMASTARRRVILEGLASLGYEIRENMEAVWVKDGRIVVGKPGATDYGVELGSPPDAGRIQVRLVGSDRPLVHRDIRRDIDMETRWCSEFQQLKSSLAESGADLILERAVGIGVQPVKTVSRGDLAPDRQDERRKPSQAQRTFPT
jgi:hypothetical protein